MIKVLKMLLKDLIDAEKEHGDNCNIQLSSGVILKDAIVSLESAIEILEQIRRD